RPVLAHTGAGVIRHREVDRPHSASSPEGPGFNLLTSIRQGNSPRSRITQRVWPASRCGPQPHPKVCELGGRLAQRAAAPPSSGMNSRRLMPGMGACFPRFVPTKRTQGITERTAGPWATPENVLNWTRGERPLRRLAVVKGAGTALGRGLG